jgi:hypothetical protein
LKRGLIVMNGPASVPLPGILQGSKGATIRLDA